VADNMHTLWQKKVQWWSTTCINC